MQASGLQQPVLGLVLAQHTPDPSRKAYLGLPAGKENFSPPVGCSWPERKASMRFLLPYHHRYCNTIQYTMENFKLNETKRRNRLGHVQSLINDLRCDMRNLLSMNRRKQESGVQTP